MLWHLENEIKGSPFIVIIFIFFGILKLLQMMDCEMDINVVVFAYKGSLSERHQCYFASLEGTFVESCQ